MPSNAYIVLYINESSDSITLNLKNEFPSIEVIYVEDQITGGGLTGTWNKGIDLCFYNNCDIIIVSNDDILFDESILNICLEAGSLKDTDMVYFGPHSNNPGNETNNIQKEYIREVQKHSRNLENIIKFQNLLVDAKQMIVNKLDKVKSIGTFIKTANGFKATNPEGYVAIDRVSGGAVKLVDRMEFSFNNFTAIKSWDK